VSAPQDVEPLPSHLGPYVVEGRLGRGGMGVVYRALHPDTGRAVALKTVRLPSERHLAAIRREIRALARIEHPGVVRIVDEGVHESGLPWYAMELLSGVTLRDHRLGNPGGLQTGDAPPLTASGPILEPLESQATLLPTQLPPLRPEEARMRELLTLFRRLCDPLAFVHGEGLVHCDLKPENVFLCHDGRSVLVDFGLISRFGAAANREVLDLELFVGTAEYMAPEQWEGKPVDARTDLYALGCILHECITGQPPFFGPRKTLYKEHLRTPPPRASGLAPGVPRALDELLQALMAKQPSLRPGHADEVARVLESLGAAPPEPGPAPRPYLFRPALVGRGRTTHDVVQRVASADEPGKLVTLGGESGVGKTRLAMEAARMAKRGGLRVLTGECQPNAGVLSPVRGVLAAVADRCHRDPGELPELLGRSARLLARLEPALLHVPGVEGQPAPEPLPPEAERTRLLEALGHTLAAFGKKERVFWVLDDLQWADAMTLDFLEHLLGRKAELSNVVILATYRSEEVPAALERLLARAEVDKVLLGRLNGRAVAKMVADMLGVEPPEGFVAFLTRESEGNPFFVAEYLRAAVGTGLLVRDPGGRWSLAAEPTADYSDGVLGLPRSLGALLGHRLDHLSPEARALVDASSVAGREVEPEQAARVAQLSAESLDVSVAELLRKQILEESGGSLLRFSHDKIREVAYGRLAEAPRRELHRRTARELEHLRGRGDAKVPSAALAHHWLEAGDPGKAVVHLDAAAEEALASGAYQEATLHLERALAASAPRDDGREVALAPLKRAGWHQRLGQTYLAAGRLEDSRTHATSALSLVHLAPPRTQGGWVRHLISQLLRQLTHRLLPEGLYQDQDNRDALAEATLAAANLARVAFFENDPLRIIASSVWAINLAERGSQLDHAARNYSGLGWTFGLARLHGVADSYFARARRVGEEAKDWAGLIFCLTSEALYRLGRGEFAVAEASLEECKALCADTQDPQSAELAETLLGHPAFYRGAFAQADQRHQAVLTSARERRNLQHVAWSLYCLARAELARGRYGEAQQHLEEARRLLEGLTDQMSDIVCAGLLASTYLRAGDLAQARAAADETVRRIGRTPPTAFITLHGFEGVAEVAVHQFGVTRAKDDLRAARRAVKRLVATTGVFPVGRPRAQLLAGRLARLEGRPRVARRALEQGVAAATRMHLEYEHACLLAELARATAGTPEADTYRRAAVLRFEELGCQRPEGDPP
jgi:serine/threonine protein kinase/tetratricopeptide (TPR) repeat protein